MALRWGCLLDDDRPPINFYTSIDQEKFMTRDLRCTELLVPILIVMGLASGGVAHAADSATVQING